MAIVYDDQPAAAPKKSRIVYDEQPEPKSSALGNVVGAYTEPAAQLASAAIAAPVAGIVGAVSAPFIGMDKAANLTSKIQEAGTYQPKTEAGQAISEVVAKPFAWVADKAKKAGGFTLEKTGSAELAAGVETAVNFLPAILTKGAIKGGGVAVSAGRTAMRNARVAADAQSLESAMPIARQAAQQAGLDWERLPGQVRSQLVSVVRESQKKMPNDPAALEREARMASHPVAISPTMGQATRDPIQITLEKQTSQTETGRPIRERFVEQNRQLQENLDTIRGRTGAKAVAPEQAGELIQKAAREKLKEQEANVRRLYGKAEQAGEMTARVDVKPLVDYFANHEKSGDIAYLIERLKTQNVVRMEPSGEIHILRPATLRELERVRQRASTEARTGEGTQAHYSGKLVGEIDKLMDATEAGPMYRAARAARRELGAEFERQGGVRKLVSEKAGGLTDRAVAMEDTFKKTVVAGSIQDLRNVVRTLNEGEKGTRKIGRQGIKELAGQTVDYLKAEATKSVATMETGEATFNAAPFVKAVDRIGRAKLETLLGKTATDELYNLTKTARDLLTEPPTRAVGSSTFANILRWMDKHATKLPIAGPVVSGTAKLAGAAYKHGTAGAQTAKALTTPYRLSERAAELEALRNRPP